jgi:SnoaL-like domain
MSLSDIEHTIIDCECRRLLNRLVVGADHDFERFLNVFSDNAIWIRGSEEIWGKAAIRASIEDSRRIRRKANPNGHLARHVLTSTDVDAKDSNRADAVAYCIVFRAKEFDGQLPARMSSPDLLVEYRSSFLKTTEGWKIVRLESRQIFAQH